ncbi:MAG: hypothetical protein V3W19_05420 [Desulfatiglandales bacterium]
MLEQDYSGFNIVIYKGRLYGVNRAEGPVDLKDIQTKARRPRVSGKSIADIKRKIDELAESGELLRLNKVGDNQPILLEEGYSGFNIVIYKGRLYGVNQAEGPMDLKDIQTKARWPWVSAKSIAEVKRKTDELAKSGTAINIMAWLKRKNPLKR